MRSFANSRFQWLRVVRTLELDHAWHTIII